METVRRYFKTLGNSIIGRTQQDIEGLLDHIDDIHEEYDYVTHKLEVTEALLKVKATPAKKAAVKKAPAKTTTRKKTTK